MRIEWTPAAKHDRDQVFDYIAAEDVRAAVKMDLIFSKASSRLERFHCQVVQGSSPARTN